MAEYLYGDGPLFVCKLQQVYGLGVGAHNPLYAYQLCHGHAASVANAYPPEWRVGVARDRRENKGAFKHGFSKFY